MIIKNIVSLQYEIECQSVSFSLCNVKLKKISVALLKTYPRQLSCIVYVISISPDKIIIFVYSDTSRSDG